MAIYAIGDLHLSQSADKPMNIFSGWDNYTEKLIANWENKIMHGDTVVLAGDISWGMSLDEAMADFQLIDRLPGEKLILKGNHDYWWASVTKMQNALAENGVTTISFLHNNSFIREGLALCGSRGWLFENGEAHDEKIVKREAMRIEASLKTAGAEKKVLFLHYPPVYAGQIQESFFDLIADYGIKQCYYGHIHGAGHRRAVEGLFRGVELHMISADYLAFDPIEIKLPK